MFLKTDKLVEFIFLGAMVTCDNNLKSKELKDNFSGIEIKS